METPNHIASMRVDADGRTFLMLTPQRYFGRLTRSENRIAEGRVAAERLASDYNSGRIWALRYA